MPTKLSQATLQHTARAYSRHLGARLAPRVRIVPGEKCWYTPFFHRISMGQDVLEQASISTILVILAHEVGHSCQSVLRLRRRYLWAMVLALVVSCIVPLGAVLFKDSIDLQRPLSWLIVFSTTPLIPITFWLTNKYLATFGNELELELDADACSVRLVSQEAALNAMAEFNELFAKGRELRAGNVRYAHIRKFPVAAEAA